MTIKFKKPGPTVPKEKPKQVEAPSLTLKIKPTIKLESPSNAVAKQITPSIVAPTVAAIPKPTIKPTISFKPQVQPIKPQVISMPSLPKLPIAEQVGRVVEGLVDQAGLPITLDKDQAKAVELAIDGQSCCIVGKAGTGKTTTVQAVTLSWLKHNEWKSTSYRQQGTGERFRAPSIAIVAFTNRAANNMAAKLIAHEKLGKDGYGFGPNITTIHNLLEYTVEFITDEETGNKKPHYFPKKGVLDKLDITHLVLEEATLVGVGDKSLWQELLDALPKGVQLLFLGDLNQLPPVIGKSILNYAVQGLPRVELTTVHRQALDNPIIRQALNCIEGKPIKEDYDPATGQGVRIFNGKATYKLSNQVYEVAFKRLIEKLIAADQFDPLKDMILSPYNKPTDKAVSAANLAKVVAGILAIKGNTPVYEIRAGFALLYLRVGDRVFIDKQEGIVKEINRNVAYFGAAVKTESHALDYFGHYSNPLNQEEDEDEDEWDYSSLSIEEILEQGDVGEEERKRAASHAITISFPQMDDSTPIDRTYSAVGEVANITLGYALSVHMSQGSEWPRVILALHDTNATNLFRELVYTGMTRPRTRLDIIAQAPVITKAISNQRIKGSTLEAKIEFFNSGYLDQDVQLEP